MENKLILTVFFVSLLLVLTINSVTAITGSIGNARMVLYPEVGFLGITIEKSILVKNVNDVPINITLEAADDIEDITTIIDKNFILEAGEEKDAVFKITLRKAGDYEGRINVYFKELEGSKAGVALSSTIIIKATKKGLWDDPDVENGDENEEPINLFGANSTIINSIRNSPLKSLLIISTLVLIIALIILFVLIKKNNNINKKGDVKVNKRKRSDKNR